MKRARPAWGPAAWLMAGMALLSLTTAVPLAAQQADEPLDELDTVLVTGEHPGPALWKVSKGDHVMWVLGTHAPLPKGMTWRSKQVVARIAESQAVLIPGEVEIGLGIGFFRGLTMIPAFLRAVQIPDKKTLKDVLPAETYGRWYSLRLKYMGGGGRTERLRPMFAIEELRDEAHRKARLTDGPMVDELVKAAAKKQKVRIQRLADARRSMKVKKDDLRVVLDTLRGLPDVQCFTQDLTEFEADLEQLKAMANAWARGDIDALRELHLLPEPGSSCDDTFEATALAEGSPHADLMKQLDAQYNRLEQEAMLELQDEWVAAARKALEKNSSTFAMLPMREVVRPDGYIAKLKELGYEVEGQ